MHPPALASSLSGAMVTVHQVGGVSEPLNEGLYTHLALLS